MNISNKIFKTVIIGFGKLGLLHLSQFYAHPNVEVVGICENEKTMNKVLKKNFKKIYTDLDVFSSHFKNQCITITGTNGKSTTCRLLHDVLKQKGYDVKLAGNIGYPILSVKNIKKSSIFVIEASSYQLEYSKLFSSKYGAILPCRK